MIIRIVKMTFKEDGINEFKKIYFESVPLIKLRTGCQNVKLLQDKFNPAIMSTLSYWDSIEALEAYRNSELFKTTWAKTKVLFTDRAEAWSFEEVESD